MAGKFSECCCGFLSYHYPVDLRSSPSPGLAARLQCVKLCTDERAE